MNPRAPEGDGHALLLPAPGTAGALAPGGAAISGCGPPAYPISGSQAVFASVGFPGFGDASPPGTPLASVVGP